MDGPASASAEQAIQVQALHKKYGAHVALHTLDLSVRTGSIFGLIGPNGAGKTTTLRILLDIIRPTSGAVEVLGQAPRTGGAALRRRIGYIPGELRLASRLSAGALLRHLAEISGPVAPGAIDALAERLGLDLTRSVRTLSKGNKQKVGLVQAFMHRPALLVLDEPTSGLDPLIQREVLAMLREARDQGQTVLLSSHVLSEIQRTADDVAVLAQGRIVAEGAVSTLRLASVRRLQATLSGTTAAAMQAALAPMPDVADLDVETAGDLVHVSVTVRGDIDGVIRAISAATIRELTVEEPDLEESVLALYSDPRSATGTASS